VLFDFGAALFDLRNQHVEAELVQDLKPVGLRFASDGRIALFSRKALYVGPAKAESVKQGLRGTGGMLWDVEFRRDDSLLVFGKGVDADVEALLQ